MFLKSKLLVIDPNSELDKSHDSLNIFKTLTKKYPPKINLMIGIRACRKYFNESRYPCSGTTVYTKEFAEQFLAHVKDVKDYIDNECQATLDDLQKKFGEDRAEE